MPEVNEADKYGNNRDQKRFKVEQAREYHAQLLADLGISPLDFNLKMPFYNRGRMVVGIFPSEFKKDKGFFFELCTRDLDPSDTNRTVYRIARNDNFEEEYEMNEKGSFLVPIEELRVVNPNSAAVSKDGILSNDRVFTTGKLTPVKQEPSAVSTKSQAVSGPKPMLAQPSVPVQEVNDAPYSEMTIRDYIAIHTGKPLSNKPWLNKLITQDESSLF